MFPLKRKKRLLNFGRFSGKPAGGEVVFFIDMTISLSVYAQK